MSNDRTNKVWFALTDAPPEHVDVGSGRYKIERVFKHDFYAATCLYHLVDSTDDDACEKIVVKFGRQSSLFGLPMKWSGEFMRRREENVYSRLEGLEGIPRWLGRLGDTGYAIEYIDAVPLDHFEKVPAGFFDRIIDLMKQVHSRGVAYSDSNKRSNILVGPDGEAFLIDFQISLLLRENSPWPLNRISRAIVDYICQRDIYHLLKHKRRMAPDELTPEEDTLSRQRDLLHRIHRKVAKGWRYLRRGFLRKRFESGRMVSPTAHLEDHIQPEKATWRKVEARPEDQASGPDESERDG